MKMYVCTHCESEAVFRIAWLGWDKEKQEWQVSTSWADMLCPDCEEDGTILYEVEEVEIPTEVSNESNNT